jgi:hypothetical protein
MPQPDFVPAATADKVRVTETLPVPEGWVANRPAEILGNHQPKGPLLGSVGPDQGYGLKLARTFVDKLQLLDHEHSPDAVMGALPVALKRAALFGRAPVIYDFELAYTLFGFLGGAPEDLLTARKELFAEASHHYEAQRAIADAVPESTLRMTPEQVRAQLGNWQALVVLQH